MRLLFESGAGADEAEVELTAVALETVFMWALVTVGLNLRIAACVGPAEHFFRVISSNCIIRCALNHLPGIQWEATRCASENGKGLCSLNFLHVG